MVLTQFMNNVPSTVRLLLALVVTVGITLIAVKLMHSRSLSISERNDEAFGKTPPPSWDLASRVLALTGTGFVFLFAFTFGNFWSNGQDASTASLMEQSAYQKALTTADSIPTDQGGKTIADAVKAYGASVRETEWPAMQAADRQTAQKAHIDAATAIGRAAMSASQAGASKSLEWDTLTSALADMTDQGTTRIAQVPGPAAPGAVALIALLGIANLALTAALLPTRFTLNLTLMGLMAAITGLLLFLIVETSNVYAGGNVVPFPHYMG